MDGWPERGCGGCSFMADQVAHLAHLNARDTTLVFVSRAPQADIERWKARMGWEHIPWYTITDDFDADFGVDEWHGTNAFIREGDQIFRTYFIDSRGDEAMGTTWSYLDITALGRQEEWEDSPEGYPQTAPYQWWNYHDALRRARRDRARRRRARSRSSCPPRARRGRGAARRPRVDRAAPAPPPGARRMSESTTLRMERTFQAPAQAVFDAWTSEEVMRRWWHAEHDWETTVAEVDLRVGGAVRVVMRDPDDGRRVRRRRALHGDRPADAGWRSRGSGTATTPGS